MKISLLGILALALFGLSSPASALPAMPTGVSAPDNLISVRHGRSHGHGMRSQRMRGHGGGHGGGHRRGGHH